MDVDPIPLVPLAPAEEGELHSRWPKPIHSPGADGFFISMFVADAIVSYRTQHPENQARLLSSQWHLSDPALLSTELAEQHQSRQSARESALDIETLRFLGSLKRLAKAKEVQDKQEKIYQNEKESIKQKRLAETLRLEQEKQAVDAARRKKESYQKCDVLAKEISGKAKSRSQLEELIKVLSSQLEDEEKRKIAYIQEADTRKRRFAEIDASLKSLLAMERLEPSRSAADLAKLPSLAPAVPATSTPSVSISNAASRLAPPALSRTTSLDPKAISFTPVVPTNLPSRVPNGRSNLGISGLPSRPTPAINAREHLLYSTASNAASTSNSRAATPSREKERDSLRESLASSTSQPTSLTVNKVVDDTLAADPESSLTSDSAVLDPTLAVSSNASHSVNISTRPSDSSDLLSHSLTRPSAVSSPLCGAHSSPAIPRIASITNSNPKASAVAASSSNLADTREDGEVSELGEGEVQDVPPVASPAPSTTSASATASSGRGPAKVTGKRARERSVAGMETVSASTSTSTPTETDKVEEELVNLPGGESRTTTGPDSADSVTENANATDAGSRRASDVVMGDTGVPADSSTSTITSSSAESEGRARRSKRLKTTE